MLTKDGRPTRGEGFTLGLVATGAVGVAIAAIVSIFSAAGEVFQKHPSVLMPVHSTDATGLAAASGVESASFESALVTFTTLSGGARWLLLLEQALPALATVALCAAAWWLGVSLIRSRPFRASMGWTVGLAACIVMSGGVFGQLAGAIGRSMAVSEVPSTEDVLWLFRIDLDLAPFGWAFALALIATAFQLGARMQKDTEGLV